MTNAPYEPGESRDPDERTDADEARTDAAIRELKARVVWPQPPDPAALSRQEQPPPAGTTSAETTHRTATPLRKVGVGILGLIGGLLVGLLARLILPSDASLPVALTLGAVTLMLAAAGVVGALVIDHRYLTRRAWRPPANRP